MTTTAPVSIELACDHHEGDEFASWLRRRGHPVTIGATTSNYVNGIRTGDNPDANEVMLALWDLYCDEAQSC